MTKTFAPRLEILPPPQRRLWDELSAVPGDFTLYGGTAIALQLAHRPSVDFDFFAFRALDPDALAPAIPFLSGATMTQREPNALSCTVERGGPVKLSFFGVPKIRALAPPLVAADNHLLVASLLDLAAAKVRVVQMRAEAKDYVDVDAILTSSDITLPMALAAACAIYGPQLNPQISLKALAFFDEGDLRALPGAVKERLTDAVRGVDLDALPTIPPAGA